MELNILKQFSLNLRMGNIEAGPPLSTILGNIGVTTVKFCKDLNEFTSELPNYFFLVIKVTIFFDKTYIFSINEPSTALLLRLLSKKAEMKIKISGGLKLKNINVIKLKDIYYISFFKFSNCDDSSLKSIIGTISSLNLYVIE